MADLVMGAMPSLIPKLYELLKEEYNLQTHVKERISSLMLELELAQAALCKVAEVLWDQLDKHVQIWARKVREASYDMEDVLDTFLVRVEGSESTEEKKSLRKHLKKTTNFFKKSMARHKISGDVKSIMTHLQEVTEQCRRYKVEDIGTRTPGTSTIDPRLHAMYTQVNKLVGVDKSSGELMSMLQMNPQRGDVSSTKTKIVSIVGVGGLGKTTLAKVVYDKIKGVFDCTAFVPVGRNLDLKKISKDIVIDLDVKNIIIDLHVKDLKKNLHTLDERQLIDRLRKLFLECKNGFLIVIDDIWEIESWETIKLAIDDDKNCGGRMIITTRNMEVATKANEVYKLQPLSHDSSRELLYARIYGDEGRHVDSQPDEISDKFIRKCGGIPLAIITMASLLVGKPRDKWSKLYNTIGFGSKDNKEAENTMRILSFSYYDLPSHLRTCLLYLSAFLEDSFIDKGSLVWMWVAEGFVHKKDGMRLFEIGEVYFNDLINRSMIQAEEHIYDGNMLIGCRVHDMVLDFIRFMSQEDNDQGTLLQQRNIVRRLANHNRTIGHPHQANHIEMTKLRSFIALRCVIETWASISSFTILRVLAIENCKPGEGRCVQVEGLRYLPHLRFLRLHGTRIDRIPEEIGSLRFLQTLDLLGSDISELPSSGSLPKQLLCLSTTLNPCKEFSVEGMTSLEELTIDVPYWRTVGWLVNGLGCLRELRVLNISRASWDEEEKRDLVESLGHLDKLQRLTFSGPLVESHAWQGKDLLLSHDLQHLAVSDIFFSELPSRINPSCLPNLSHLDLSLEHLDEEDLKTLGGLPELHYSLDLVFMSRPATMHNISDSDACYFPKLRCFKLKQSMFSFVVSKDDKRVSFHIWNGKDRPSVSDDELEMVRPSISDDESMPSVSDDVLERAWPSVSDDESMPFVYDDELHSPRPSVFDDELKIDDETQSPMSSVSHDDELHRPLESSKLQQGLAAVAYYLLAFFLQVLAYVKRWPLKLMGQHPFPCNHASSPRNGKGNGEEPATTPSVSDDENKGSTICSKGAAAAPPRFMPSLQVLHFEAYSMRHIPNLVYSLGLEHLSSLREINAYLADNELETELRRAAEVHPNHPTLNVKRRY